jgi:hypothetical protein
LILSRKLVEVLEIEEKLLPANDVIPAIAVLVSHL